MTFKNTHTESCPFFRYRSKSNENKILKFTKIGFFSFLTYVRWQKTKLRYNETYRGERFCVKSYNQPPCILIILVYAPWNRFVLSLITRDWRLSCDNIGFPVPEISSLLMTFSAKCSLEFPIQNFIHKKHYLSKVISLPAQLSNVILIWVLTHRNLCWH